MVLKRQISYRWRLFVPVTVTLWLLVLGMAMWHIHRESRFREEYVATQLDFVTQRVITSINDDAPEVNSRFLSYVDRYYDRNPVFSDIRVTIYDRDWNVTGSCGTPIVLSAEDRDLVQKNMIELDPSEGNLNRTSYFFMGAFTDDGNHFVVTGLPNGPQLQQYMSGDRNRVLAIVCAIALALTVLLYYSTKYISKNIVILRAFANRMATDPDYIPGTEFPHDELGDVARQIVKIYNERTAARRRVDEEHAVAMHAIREKAHQKRQLTNNVNHELKTPIGVIKGYLDTLAENPDLDGETRTHFIGKARDHANRLAELVNDISAITRLEDGGNAITTEDIDYHEVVYNFANDVADSGALGAMQFTFDVPMGTYVRGNANLLGAMLMNLARNAANYSGGTMCRLVCEGTCDDGAAYRFAFFDDGCGVPGDALPRLFDRFYRIDTGRARKSGGTGLGLAIVHNTVTAHRGTITGSNRPGGGLQITFTLPRAD